MRPPRPPGAADPPKISDRFDGVDNAYHVLVTTANAPQNAVLELYLGETTIDTLDPVPGRPGVYELYWQIPDSLGEGAATLKVRMYALQGSTLEEVAAAEIAVEMNHRSTTPPVPDQAPADETVEITWPNNGGLLGFYKPKGGPWRAAIDAYASDRTEQVDVLYSKSAPGTVPEFVNCGTQGLYSTAQYFETEIPFSTTCTLVGTDVPSQVKAIAVVTHELDDPDRTESGTGNELTQDSADVHLVNTYLQTPSLMTVNVAPDPNTQWPAARRRRTSGCIPYKIVVTDHLSRPVQGANVDTDIAGPGDTPQYADESDPTAAQGGNASGGHQPPDKGGHRNESARDCDGNMGNAGQQGEHNVPAGEDIKHQESIVGTGIDGGGPTGGGLPHPPGQWRFHVWSGTAGLTQITAWVDDEEIANEAADRELNDDIKEQGEASDTEFAQWYSANPTLDFDPLGNSSPAGTCTKYVLKARAGTAVIAGTNVDIHATGPDDALDFCDPGGATTRRAPDKPTDGPTEHTAEDAGESVHVSSGGADTQHTEGETDDQGNFVFGVVTAESGDTQFTAWLDGEKEFDDDELGTGEALGSATHSWTKSAGDAEIELPQPDGVRSDNCSANEWRGRPDQSHDRCEQHFPDPHPSRCTSPCGEPRGSCCRRPQEGSPRLGTPFG